MHKPELLAPAGSKEALVAAIENGADAVYLGGKAFSARQYASNFTNEELEWAIDYAHVRGVRAYVTVNTLVKDSELDEACDYLQFLCNAGADAVIVQDLGVLRLLREQFPELPVHASTQMTIHNVEGVKVLEEMGVKRVVLARELSLEEIKRIKSQTNMEIETFIHGALCFSYSGQCLLSSMIGGRSGNRGYCAQPCRKKYRIGEAEGYLLSPRDLNISEYIPVLVEAGIDSFKIEGRMKRHEYVAGVVRIYRNLIERYLEAPEKFHVTTNEKQTLLALFNRGFTTGYFFGNPGSELMSRKYPYNIGTEIGTAAGYDSRKKLLSVRLNAPLRVGDGIGTEGEGIIVRRMYVNNQKVSEADSCLVKIPCDIEVSKGSAIFKTHDSRLMASLETKSIKKIPVKISIKARIDEPIELRINDGRDEIMVHGGIASRAESKPVSRESIAVQLKKLGNTIFEAQEISFDLSENIFIPVSLLNVLRRNAVAMLESERAQKWKRQCKKPEIVSEKKNKQAKPLLAVNTSTIEGLEAAVDGGADVVYIGDERSFVARSDYEYAIDYAHKKGSDVLICTPRIVKEIGSLKIGLDTDGFLVSNLGVLYHLHSLHNAMPIIIDYPLNVFNKLSMDYFLNYGTRVTLSPELTLEEIRKLAPYGAAECIVHGNFPLMVSEHNIVGCLFPEDRKDVLLKDEKRFAFPVRTDSQGRTYVMNSRELCMLEYVPEILEAGVECLRIEAGMYDCDMTRKVTSAYREAIGKNIGKSCSGEYTTGHYFRGVV